MPTWRCAVVVVVVVDEEEAVPHNAAWLKGRNE
jgi:hypothetical protein